MKLKGIELKGTYKVKFYDDYFEVCNNKGEPFLYGKVYKKPIILYGKV